MFSLSKAISVFSITLLWCIVVRLPASAGGYEYTLKLFIEELKLYPGAEQYSDFIQHSFLRAHQHYQATRSKEYYDQLLCAADTISNKTITSLIYAQAATSLADMSDADCFFYLEKGIALAEKYHSVTGKLVLLQKQVYIQNLQQIPTEEKIKNLDELFHHMHLHDFRVGMASVLRDKAILYYSQQQYDSSAYYIKEALTQYLPYLTNNSIINLYNALGLIEEKNGNYKMAISLFNKVIQLATAIKDTAWIGIASGNKGMVYYHMGRYDSALIHLKGDIEYSLKAKEYGSACNAMVALGELYETIYQQPDSAVKYFTLAKKMIRNGNPQQILRVNHDLYRYYVKKRDFENALRHYEQYIYLKDSLGPLMTAQRIQELEKQFKMQKKDREIEILAKENEIRRKQSQQTRIISVVLVVFIIMLSIMLYLIYRARKQERHARLQISRQSEELKRLNEIKDSIFSILSHDMRSPIAALKSLLDMWDEGLINENEYDTIKEKIKNQLFNLNIVLDNILQWSKSQIQGTDIHDEIVFPLHEIVMRNVRLFELQARNKNIHIHVEVNEHLKTKADKNKIDIVVRNLLSNAIKFSRSGGVINVHAKQDNGTIVVAFQDTGVGISSDIRDKLFEIRGVSRQHGTAGEGGTGLGLWLCKRYIEQNKGTIYFESASGKGSIFYIKLPVANGET